MKKIYQTPDISVVEWMWAGDVLTYSTPNDDAIITEDDNWVSAFQG